MLYLLYSDAAKNKETNKGLGCNSVARMIDGYDTQCPASNWLVVIPKVTIILAPQSGSSAEGISCRGEFHRHAGTSCWGPTWGSGSIMSSPAGSGVEALPPANFLCTQIKSELIFGHQCVSIWLQMGRKKQRSLSMSGQIRDTKPIRGHSPGRTVIIFWDCPRKSGTDGHLTHTSTDVCWKDPLERQLQKCIITEYSMNSIYVN